jgi:hypothetical protein
MWVGWRPHYKRDVYRRLVVLYSRTCCTAAGVCGKEEPADCHLQEDITAQNMNKLFDTTRSAKQKGCILWLGRPMAKRRSCGVVKRLRQSLRFERLSDLDVVCDRNFNSESSNDMEHTVANRSYNISLCDSPGVSEDPAVTLDWGYTSEDIEDVHEFETKRPPRRNGKSEECLKLEPDERVKMLQKAGSSCAKIRNAIARSRKARNLRKKTARDVNKAIKQGNIEQLEGRR